MFTKAMNREQAKELLDKYNNGSADARERALLENWFLQESSKTHMDDDQGKFLLLKAQIWEETLRNAGLSTKRRGKKFRLWPSIAASVAIIGLAGALFFYFTSNKQPVAIRMSSRDVAPGGTKATLTLSNGKQISLTDAENGSLAQQSGVKITKLADGQIVYSISSETEVSADKQSIQENTISTPNGGKYAVILPDGSKVTLNAASSLTFPTAFSGGLREVKLDGEAYFEVAKNKNMPFIVSSPLQKVRVLGTHFNINAYSDERTVRTTLVEGSVEVSTAAVSEVIVPGQQTEIGRNNLNKISKKHVDVDAETAWKDDVFSFDNADVKSVMRQISRWYDVEVIYIGQFPDEQFVGEISRKSNLSKVAKILELNNIRLEITGKTARVSYFQNKLNK
jgi:transmembrane sensor